MTQIKKIAGTLVLSVMLSACALPQSNVKSGTHRPTLEIVGAPKGSTLFVDGISMGDASQFDGHNQLLTVEEGLHTVSIKQNGGLLHKEKVYASGDETSKIEVGGGDL